MNRMSEPVIVSEAHRVALRRHNERVQRRNEAAAAQARAALPSITRMLREDYSATKIILFGSLARGHFTVDSDIDLAAENISPEKFFHALGDVNSIAPCWVDLKPLETLEPHFLLRVMQTGEELP
jgi:predicted nucleotidyltransferase